MKVFATFLLLASFIVAGCTHRGDVRPMQIKQPHSLHERTEDVPPLIAPPPAYGNKIVMR